MTGRVLRETTIEIPPPGTASIPGGRGVRMCRQERTPSALAVAYVGGQCKEPVEPAGVRLYPPRTWRSPAPRPCSGSKVLYNRLGRTEFRASGFSRLRMCGRSRLVCRGGVSAWIRWNLQASAFSRSSDVGSSVPRPRSGSKVLYNGFRQDRCTRGRPVFARLRM